MRAFEKTAFGLFVALIGATFATPLLAAEVTFTEYKGKDGTPSRILYLEGRIERGDLAKIRSVAEGSYVRYIYLWSPGGDVSEALAISDYLNDKLISASVPVSLADYRKLSRTKVGMWT